MTANPDYDAPLSALRNHVEDVAVALAIWEGRHEPDAAARRAASDAVGAIDRMLTRLYGLRAELTADIRAADAASAARADKLLRDRAEGR